MSKRDGGLIDAVLDRVIELKEDELSGFEKFGRDFVIVDGQENHLPRLVVNSGSNRIIRRTNAAEYRELFITFKVWGKTNEQVGEQASRLCVVLDRWSENPEELSGGMDEGCYPREMSISDQIETHEQQGVWSLSLPTQWEISIARS
jgi:hypothetical protein